MPAESLAREPPCSRVVTCGGNVSTRRRRSRAALAGLLSIGRGLPGQSDRPGPSGGANAVYESPAPPCTALSERWPRTDDGSDLGVHGVPAGGSRTRSVKPPQLKLRANGTVKRSGKISAYQCFFPEIPDRKDRTSAGVRVPGLIKVFRGAKPEGVHDGGEHKEPGSDGRGTTPRRRSFAVAKVGYHFRKVAGSSPLTTLVRVCSRRWGPRVRPLHLLLLGEPLPEQGVHKRLDE